MKRFLLVSLSLLNLNVFAQVNHAAMSSMTSADSRKPLKLTSMMAEHQKQNMRDHLEAVRDLTEAFIDKNYKKIEEAGKRLGTSPEMQMMCNHMGKNTPGFTEMGLKMHKEADKIILAARKKDMKAVLVATNKTLQSCTNCHSSFKQEIVSEDVWNKL